MALILTPYLLVFDVRPVFLHGKCSAFESTLMLSTRTSTAGLSSTCPVPVGLPLTPLMF